MNEQSKLSILIEAVNNAGGTFKSIASDFKNMASNAASANATIKNTGSASGFSDPKLAALAQRAREATIAYNQMKNSGTASSEEINRQRNIALNLSREFGNLRESQNGVTSSTKNLTGSFILGNLAAQAIAATYSTLKGAASAAIDSASNVEQANVAFTTMTGSAQVATQTLEALSQLSMKQAMSFPDAVTGAKRIMAYGISAQEVIPIMSSLGDITAGVGKEKMPFLTLALGQVYTKTKLYGQELRQFTEAGVPLLQVLAEQSGKTTSQIQQDMEGGVGPSYSQVRDALISMTQEGGKFYDLAGKQANTFSGTMQRVKNQIGIVLRSIMGITEGGQIIEGGPFAKLKQAAETFFSFLDQHKDTIVTVFRAALSGAITIVRVFKSVIDFLGPSFIAGAMGAIALAVGIAKVVPVIKLASLAMMGFVTSPWGLALMALAVVVGVVLKGAFDKMMKSTKQATSDSDSLADSLKNGVSNGADNASASVNKLGDQLAKIDQQIKTANRDFIESMAEMVKSHQDKAASIRSQIDEENSSFNDSQAERLANWNKTQADMLLTHQQKVDNLNRQIAYEVAKGSQADQQKLASLQSELNAENLSYSQSFSEKQQQYQTDTANAKAEHDKKLTDLQTQLSAETSFLTKHAADIAAVRDVTLLDELDKLKRSHDEQIKSYEDQKNEAIKNSQETTSAISANFDSLVNDINSKSGNMGGVGKDFGKAFANGIIDSLKGLGIDIGRAVETLTRGLSAEGLYRLIKNKGNVSKTIREQWDAAFIHRETGGNVAAGSTYMVGEKGPEMFVPDSGGTIIPANQTASMMSGSNGDIYNINITAGAMMGNKKEAQEFAQTIWRELQAIARRNGKASSVPNIGIRPI